MDFDITSINSALFDKDYQAHITKNAESILGNEESISLSNLKNNSIFKKYYDELDDKGKATVEKIAGMQDDKQNVTEKELKVILTAMDANLENNKFHFDGKPSLSSTGGLNEATDKELQNIYNFTKTRAEKKMEEEKKLAEQRAQKKALDDAENLVKNPNLFDKDGNLNKENMVKALSLFDKIEDDDLQDKYKTEIFGEHLQDKPQNIRDNVGMSHVYILKDGTRIYEKRGLDPNGGTYIVTNPDGSQEAYRHEGANAAELKLNSKTINVIQLTKQLSDLSNEEDIEKLLKETFGDEVKKFKHVKKPRTAVSSLQNYIIIRLNDGTSMSYSLNHEEHFGQFSLGYPPHYADGIVVDKDGKIQE